MKRGIRFEIPNQHGKFIADILQPIDCFKYKWYIDRNEIWKSDDVGTLLFASSCIDGQKFFDLIKSDDYYIIFAEIKAFPKSSPVTKISKYEEFIESKCEIMLLLYDSSYVDIYCKDEEVIEKLYINAKSRDFSNLEYIDEKDRRIVMHV